MFYKDGHLKADKGTLPKIPNFTIVHLHLITTGLYMIPKLVHIKLSCLLESNCAGMLTSKMEPFIIRKLDVVGTFSSFFLLFVPNTLSWSSSKANVKYFFE